MTTTPEETRMTIDPNYCALLRAVGKLTTQVGRIADTLADGTARDAFALAPPVVTDDDGAQTTTLHAPNLSDRPIRTITSWLPACPSGHHPAHALQTCDEIDAFTAFVQDRVQQQSAAEAQTTPDDATRPQLMGDGIPLPWPAPPYKLCSASTHGALGRTVGPCVLRYRHDGPVHTAADGTIWEQRMTNDVAPDWQHVTAIMRENEQLRTELARVRAELDRINTRPDPTDGNISLTIGEQLAMAANLEKITAAFNRVRELHTPDDLLCRACATRSPCPTLAALDGPATEG